jgi:hypothetical protein
MHHGVSVCRHYSRYDDDNYSDMAISGDIHQLCTVVSLPLLLRFMSKCMWNNDHDTN